MWKGAMALVEPIIVVLGTRCGGTSAVAGVLNHLGVFMGTEFSLAARELNDSWEDLGLHQLCSRAFSEPGDQLQMDPDLLRAKLRRWADDHRAAARIAGRRPGAKDPCLCLAIDFIRAAWGPIVPVAVDRPFDKVVASLNRLGWLPDEQERAASTARLIAARDRALAGTATVRVDFEALRATPALVIRRLADDLGLEVTDTQIAAAAQSVVKTVDLPRDVDPYQRFIDRLLPEVTRNPTDARSMSLLAQAYFDSGDFANAHKWFTRKIEIGGRPDEEIFLAMLRVAQSMEKLEMPWPAVQDAYLRAWEFRPTRAEPLYAIALRYRAEKRYRLGYMFAQRAAEIPLPEDDMLVPYPEVYAWRATDDQAVCAYRIGKHDEAFTLWRRVLARPDLPDNDRRRIAINRDLGVPAMIEAVSSYPDAVVKRLTAQRGSAEVVVSLVADPDRGTVEKSLNSFLSCCTDVADVGRFLVLDTGLAAGDRAILQERYGFLEFSTCATTEPLAQLRTKVDGRFWLHLGQGWLFFAQENLIARLIAVLEAEADVFQVGINFGDAATLTSTSATEQMVRRTPGAGRYVLTDVVARGPAMFDTARLDRATVDGLKTASLDEVLCVATG
jgi:tetratricopeptide (TPR) repeat protein